MCAVLILYPFGSCIAYLIIVGDVFQPLLCAALATGWWTGRSAVIAGVGCACILPLCFPKRLAALKAVSSLCLYGLITVVGVIVLRSGHTLLRPDHDWRDVKAANLSVESLSAIPLIVFAFNVSC
jgi:amino acid permease